MIMVYDNVGGVSFCLAHQWALPVPTRIKDVDVWLPLKCIIVRNFFPTLLKNFNLKATCYTLSFIWEGKMMLKSISDSAWIPYIHLSQITSRINREYPHIDLTLLLWFIFVSKTISLTFSTTLFHGKSLLKFSRTFWTSWVRKFSWYFSLKYILLALMTALKATPLE